MAFCVPTLNVDNSIFPLKISIPYLKNSLLSKKWLSEECLNSFSNNDYNK